MKTLKMEDMTSEEIKNAVADGKNIAIVMLASMEQHGPHLPINTDTLSAQVIGEKIVEGLGNALLAPIITIGCSKHHFGFSGTFSLDEDTFKSVLGDVCESLFKSNFEWIFLIPSHGGNIPPAAEATEDMQKVHLITLDDFDEIVDKLVREVIDLPGDYLHSCHAGLMETSFMMDFFPDKLRKEAIVKGRTNKFNQSVLVRGGSTRELSENGILGNPTFAKSGLGKRVIQRLVKRDIEEIRKIINK